ncbi:defender against death DAD protein [Parathielavia appendiculata]|uniref:Dolichyl-diphosphooligosaccharide--protein glycosyltransferase subunit OST2 n=1 Tax=Parathielavia appendiculata TaxID=2587402 RepID=A0AAN6U9M8_9PEZI|nr:defender against death DAD protein [Parathielavia appendiculata]
MAPKQRNAAAQTPPPSSTAPPTRAPAWTPSPPTTTPKPSLSKPTTTTTTGAGGGVQTWDKIINNVLSHYLDTTPQRTKLLDAFMVFLVAVGALQFVYCVLAGNYPFNAFLSGFAATVGQFVLTASLRIQTTEANKGDFPCVSPERAFADYVVCSLILHFFCVNFIN